MNTNYSECIHKLLDASEISGADLATALGVSPSYISKIRTGCLVPAKDRLEELAGILKLTQTQIDSLISLTEAERKLRRDTRRRQKALKLLQKPYVNVDMTKRLIGALEDLKKQREKARIKEEAILNRVEKFLVRLEKETYN